MKRQVIEVLSGKGNTSALTTNDLFILVNEIMEDIFVTGGTYTNGTAIFTNNTGGTFNVTGFYVPPVATGGKVVLKKIDLGNRIINDANTVITNLYSILINTFLTFLISNASNNYGTNIDFYATQTNNKERKKIFWGTITIDGNAFSNISTLLSTIVSYYETEYNNGQTSPVNFYCEHYVSLTPTNYSPTQVRLTNTLFNSLNPFKYSRNKNYQGISEFIRTNSLWNPTNNIYDKINLKTISSDFRSGWINYYDVSFSEDITKKIFDIITLTDLYGNLSLTASTAILPYTSYDNDTREIIKNSVFVENLTNFYSKNKIPVNRNGFGSTSVNLLNNFFGYLLYNIDGNPKNNPIYSNSNTNIYPTNAFYQYVDTYRILPTGVKKVIYSTSPPNSTLLNYLSYNNLTTNEKYIKTRDKDYIQVLPGYKEIYILEIDVIETPTVIGAGEFITWIIGYSIINDKSAIPYGFNLDVISSQDKFNDNPYGPYMIIQSNDELMYQLSINSTFTPTTGGKYIIKSIYKGYSFRPMIYPLNMNQITFEVPKTYLWDGNNVNPDDNFENNKFLTDNNINITNKKLRFIVKYTKLQEYDVITSDLIITQQRSVYDNKFITLTINDIKGGESIEQTIYKNISTNRRKQLRPGSVEIYLSICEIDESGNIGYTSLIPNYKIIITNYGDNEIFKLIKEGYVINNLFL